MKKSAVVLAVFLLVLSGTAKGQEVDNSKVFIKPFLVHSGLSPRLGQYDFRATALLSRGEAGEKIDFGVHYETGIVADGISMCFRTDGIQNEKFLDYTWQYNVANDTALNNGFAVYAGFAVPTGSDVSRSDYRGLLGLSYRMTFGQVAAWNAGIEKDTAINSIEYESSFLFKVSERCFPSLEIRGVIKGSDVTAYVFPGLKVKVNDNSSVGMGVQGAVSLMRDFDIEALFTFDTSF
ncbi:MAG: hypothetical protein A2231_06315 [Candidatus Firestonebacteria bacterium RIFOXYA2_FULL_40_8]|nr:MAG: hypothetical protein A2231_06315 [Candidatus Firestonebacteria bacterium RIFOXYA2_FULL_40_8]